MVFATQDEIEHLAGRIKVAYRRRGVAWNEGCSTSRVWAAAAMVLLQCRLDDADVPTDPELFVASQPINAGAADPWTDLASAAAGDRYRKRIRGIVRQLRAELDREIRLAENMLRRGRTLGDILDVCNNRLSPLGRYIVARRAMRRDLADRWSREAREQHESCPLYRNASVGLLSLEEYPSSRESMPFGQTTTVSDATLHN